MKYFQTDMRKVYLDYVLFLQRYVYQSDTCGARPQTKSKQADGQCDAQGKRVGREEDRCEGYSKGDFGEHAAEFTTRWVMSSDMIWVMGHVEGRG